MKNSGKYYARTDEEKKFDSELRDAIADSGSPSEMALYIQNQAILSMLRRLEETIDTMELRGCKDYE